MMAPPYSTRIESEFGLAHRIGLWSTIACAAAAIAVTVLYLQQFDRLLDTPNGPWFMVGFGVTLYALALVAFAALQYWSVAATNALYLRASDEMLVVDELALRRASARTPTDRRWQDPPPDTFVPWTELHATKWAAHTGAWKTLCEAFRDIQDPVDVVGQPLLAGRACADCGNSHAPVHCSDCGSIQWADLSRARLAKALPAWHYALAAFVAKYRVQMLAAVMSSAFAVASAASGTSMFWYYELRHERQTRMDRTASNVVESIIQFRRALVGFEIDCSASTKTPACAQLHHEFHENYYRFSWHATPLMLDLQQRYCGQQHLTASSEGACRWLDPDRQHEHLIDAIDRRYRDYLAVRRTSTAEDGSHDDRTVAAMNLYYHSKVAACVVATLAWTDGGSMRPTRALDSCVRVLSTTEFTPLSDADLPPCNSPPSVRYRTWCRAPTIERAEENE